MNDLTAILRRLIARTTSHHQTRRIAAQGPDGQPIASLGQNPPREGTQIDGDHDSAVPNHQRQSARDHVSSREYSDQPTEMSHSSPDETGYMCARFQSADISRGATPKGIYRLKDALRNQVGSAT